jgi:hypothetical protein
VGVDPRGGQHPAEKGARLGDSPDTYQIELGDVRRWPRRELGENISVDRFVPRLGTLVLSVVAGASADARSAPDHIDEDDRGGVVGWLRTYSW